MYTPTGRLGRRFHKKRIARQELNGNPEGNDDGIMIKVISPAALPRLAAVGDISETSCQR